MTATRGPSPALKITSPSLGINETAERRFRCLAGPSPRSRWFFFCTVFGNHGRRDCGFTEQNYLIFIVFPVIGTIRLAHFLPAVELKKTRALRREIRSGPVLFYRLIERPGWDTEDGWPPGNQGTLLYFRTRPEGALSCSSFFDTTKPQVMDPACSICVVICLSSSIRYVPG